MAAAQDGHGKSIVKAVSWRALGSADTFVVSYFVTGNFAFAGSIASAETLTKIVLFYVHERAWATASLGRWSAGLRTGLGRAWGVVPGTPRLAGLGFPSGRSPLRSAKLVLAGACGLYLLAMVGAPMLAGRSHGPVTAAVATPAEARSDAIEVPAVPVLPVPVVGAFALASAAGDPVQRRREPAPVEETPAKVEPPPSAQAHNDPVPTSLLSAASATDTTTHFVVAEPPRPAAGAAPTPPDPFVGVWGTDATACAGSVNRSGDLLAVIDDAGAWAGETRCAFRTKARTAEGWAFRAQCANGAERWTAHVRLRTSGRNLTWTSERGASRYVRCEQRLRTAQVSVP